MHPARFIQTRSNMNILYYKFKLISHSYFLTWALYTELHSTYIIMIKFPGKFHHSVYPNTAPVMIPLSAEREDDEVEQRNPSYQEIEFV